MPEVLVIGQLHKDGLNVLRSRNDVRINQIFDPEEAATRAAAATAHAILVRTSRLSGSTINAAGNLKVVSRHGVGYDNIDLAALTTRRIPLTVVGDVNAVA